MILVAYWHGLRASELTSLRVSNFHDGFLTLQRLKGSKRTTQPLMSHTNPLLDERAGVAAYLKTLRDERLFPISRVQFWRLMRQHGKLAGLPVHKLHPHALKHSIAMEMIRQAGIENTRQYLGHKSGASTMEYLKASDEEAAAAVARAEQQRVDTSSISQEEAYGQTSVAETLRRLLRQIEQTKAKGSRKSRKNQ